MIQTTFVNQRCQISSILTRYKICAAYIYILLSLCTHYLKRWHFEGILKKDTWRNVKHNYGLLFHFGMYFSQTSVFIAQNVSHNWLKTIQIDLNILNKINRHEKLLIYFQTKIAFVSLLTQYVIAMDIGNDYRSIFSFKTHKTCQSVAINCAIHPYQKIGECIFCCRYELFMFIWLNYIINFNGFLFVEVAKQ